LVQDVLARRRLLDLQAVLERLHHVIAEQAVGVDARLRYLVPDGLKTAALSFPQSPFVIRLVIS